MVTYEPSGVKVPVQPIDVVFGIHGLILTIVIVVQMVKWRVCVTTDDVQKPTQEVSSMAWIFICYAFLSIVICGMVVQFKMVDEIDW